VRLDLVKENTNLTTVIDGFLQVPF